MSLSGRVFRFVYFEYTELPYRGSTACFSLMKHYTGKHTEHGSTEVLHYPKINKAENSSIGCGGLVVPGSIPISLKIRHVLGLLHIKSDVGTKRPPADVVRKFGEGVPAHVSSSSFDRGSKLSGPSPNSSRVASKRDINITKAKLKTTIIYRDSLHSKIRENVGTGASFIYRDSLKSKIMQDGDTGDSFIYLDSLKNKIMEEDGIYIYQSG
ncbi:hypothetical protein AVEN_24811-1 [Araneus ventricosus]|uniref:Uncharacterized protein n=1 Tax=Araneus ventricosus TaxID=182803 RepID=A0A4Y2BTP6_ARAVE|nr:hypothetical protein AVEN_24811-1 [Araneus ventricosus]